MACPVKYRAIGDFHSYYSGINKAPYLTIFVGGNHEASSHLWELFYGGWVAPNIFYMGAANVVQLGGLRIAGMSGIWKGYNYNKHHYERLPYNDDDVRSIYHVREIDIRKLLQLRSQVDIGISHDWPKAIEKNGNERALYRMKPDFERESKDGTLGNTAAAYVLDRLRPPYWFSAHMHCKFSATKTYEDAPKPQNMSPQAPRNGHIIQDNSHIPEVTHNTDEIDLDMDDDGEDLTVKFPRADGTPSNANQGGNSSTDADVAVAVPVTAPSSVPSDLRSQLPAAFSRPAPRRQPGQPPPAGITNKVVRFLALDKCLPGRKYLQLLEVQPYANSKEITISLSPAAVESRPKLPFTYDPEWLAITRVFAPDIILGDKHARISEDMGESAYMSLIDKEQEWVNENIVKAGKLEIPENFQISAPPYYSGMPEIVEEGPVEYNNPQMKAFCDLIGIENKFFATDSEREERLRNGPAPKEDRGLSSRGRRGGRGHGRGRGRGRRR